MSPTRRRLARRGRRWAAVRAAAGAGLAAGLLLVPLTGAAGAQGAGGSARLVGLEAWCGQADVAMSGALELDVPLGAAVAHRYEVVEGERSLGLGDAEVVATASTARSTPFVDDVWFGPRWTGGLPFTYVQETVVRVDGVVTYEQRVEARCTEDGAPAVLTVTEEVPPSTTTSTTTSPSTSTPAPSPTPEGKVVPRYAG